MSLTDKLDKLMLEKKISKLQLSKESDIPYTTIVGFYTKGTDNVKLSTLRKLADYFQCSLDYLVDDNCCKNFEDDIDSEVKELTDMIFNLDEEDKNAIINMINILSSKNKKKEL